MKIVLVVRPNGGEPEDIILSFNAIQGKHIKSLPLHSSQKILIDNEDKLRIQLKLFITHDFFMELLSHGKSLKVIQPQSLIDNLQATIKEMQEIYKD